MKHFWVALGFGMLLVFPAFVVAKLLGADWQEWWPWALMGVGCSVVGRVWAEIVLRALDED